MKTIAVIAVLCVPISLVSSQSSGERVKLGRVLVFNPTASASRPQAGSHRFVADRGGRKGQSIVVTVADAPGTAAAGTEYHLLAPETVGPLPEVDVLGVHYQKVRPERREQFETFVRDTLHPAVGNLRSDLRLLYYKAVRGAEAGTYILVFALTRESRDKYWPGGSDSDALRAAFKNVQPLADQLLPYLVEGSALTDAKFAARVFESREWTDWVLTR